MTNQSPSASDELEPARAIRRALAVKGLKAREVDLIAVWATGPLARERAELAATMGLGRFTDRVRAVFDEPDPIAYCAAAVARGDVAVAVGLVIGPTGHEAVAFARP